MGAMAICNCYIHHPNEPKAISASMSSPIILKDDPCLIYYNQNDLNETLENKKIEDLIVTGSYKSNKNKNYEVRLSVFLPNTNREEFYEVKEIINNFTEGIRIRKLELDKVIIKIDPSSKNQIKDQKICESFSNIIEILNDKNKMFFYMLKTYNEILKFKKLIIESLDRIKRNIKCTKYNNEITIFENYMAKKFYRNEIKDFESEIEFINNIFNMISEEKWDVDDMQETDDIFIINEENIKLHFNFANKLDFIKFIHILSEMKNSLLKLRKMNEDLLDVLREIYSPFKNMLEKLNRSSRIFNNNFDDESKEIDDLLKYYNGTASKQLNKISYSLK